MADPATGSRIVGGDPGATAPSKGGNFVLNRLLSIGQDLDNHLQREPRIQSLVRWILNTGRLARRSPASVPSHGGGKIER